ncbi:dihydropteroate synthase [Rhodoligotrophos appendicifer]|uniref:dihydropteroate synthase n=1 Tax=Rhodoligotrophos appendicifer TaxID=987056 RepID=UPI001961FAF1|nr:dihydropteroate synthase [Rhodoligotrophos appendicifer]
MAEVYLRPMGILHGAEARAAIASGVAVPLAGGPAAFSLAQILARDEAKNKVIEIGGLTSTSDAILKERLQALMAPRAPVAGLDFSRPLVMGIVNVTPDSFSDGGEFADSAEAIRQGRALAAAGADILDIGGESTRPFSQGTDLDEERQRVIPVIEALRDTGVPISIDTRKSSMMIEAVSAGAAIVNDVSALTYDAASPDAVARLQVPVILMHSQGPPETMQVDPTYEHVLLDVYDSLAGHIARAEEAGINRGTIIADPGIGFGKTHLHNMQLMAGLSLFHGLGVPLLLGASRKGFIGTITGEKEARHRISGSVSAAMAGMQQGIQMVRVHDVRETVQALAVWFRLNDPR